MEFHFDRGSVLVDLESIPSPGAGLSVERKLPEAFRWDSRVAGWRAEAYRWPAILSWLEERRIRFTYRCGRPEGFSPLPAIPERLPVLRPYQMDAHQAWTAASRRGQVSLPTGSGKTRLAVWAILSLGLPALVIAPTRELVHQWIAVLGAHYPGPLGRYGDGERNAQPITVSTYESAHRHLDVLGDHFDLLVVDEAHHLTSLRWSEIPRMTTAPFRLGLSATLPGEPAERASLEDLLGPVCFQLPFTRLGGTFLADVDVLQIPLRLDPREKMQYLRQRSLFLERYLPFVRDHPLSSWSDFTRAALRSPAGREALRALRRSRLVLQLPRAKLNAIDQLLDRHADQPTLVFTADTASAYEISRRFLIPAITCEIERRERREVLDRFGSGVYRALVSAKVLNEGIDVPQASVAIVAGGSSSPIEHAQRIGRVLRPLPGKRAVVYELIVAGTSEWKASERRNRAHVPGKHHPL